MQLLHGNCQVAPGPRHDAPSGFSVTRPYEITHPSRAFRAVLDCQLVKSIGFFHICMVLLRATRRGPSRDRRKAVSKSNVSGHPALGPNLSWWSPRVKGIVAPHVRDHLRVSMGTPGALSTTVYPSATYVNRLIPWRGSRSKFKS